MRQLIILIVIAIPPIASADAPKPRPEYAEFSRLVHKVVVKQLPQQFEEDSGWGQFVEVSEDIKLPRLREMVEVGGHYYAPHGAWRRFKGTIENPDKNLKIVVKDFKIVDEKTYRIVADVEATILCHGEWQQWQRGIPLIGMEASADADFKAAVVCDIGVSLNLDKLPPELNIEPKVKELGLDLVEVRMRDGFPLKGDRLRARGIDMKDLLRVAVKASEPAVKELVNQAIKDGLREGKGTISADAIMKALPK